MVAYSKNPEYADLRFAWPKAYGNTRTGRGWNQPLPRLLVVHYTAGSESTSSAENGAGYDQTRTDGTSAHYYVDADSIVQCVPTWMRSNTAMRNGNTLGIHYELCGTIQTRAQWLEPNSRAIIRRAAGQMRRDAAKWKIPIRRLTPAQVAAGQAGICGHVDITLAFPADGGTHTDPGAAFPWDVLLADINDADTLGDEMAWDLTTDPNFRALMWRVRQLSQMAEEVPNAEKGEVNQLAKTLRTIEEKVAAGTPVKLSAEDRAGIVADLVAALGPQLRKILDEELDEQSRGGADADPPD